MRGCRAVIGVGIASAVLAGCGDVAGSPSHPRSATSSSPPGASGTDNGTPMACSATRLPPAYAGRISFAASLDGVDARLTAVAARRGYDQWLVLPRLRLAARGQRWTTAPRPAPESFRHRYRPLELAGPGDIGGYLCLVRFDRAGPPVAVLVAYTGGAHCCTALRIYDVSRRRTDTLATGNMNARVIVANDRPVIDTRDDVFSYAFADFADSGAPVRLLRPGRDGFTTVTSSFPALVREDARDQWRQAHRRRITLGFYAAWAADEELLGRDRHVWRTMRRLDKRGQLTVPDGQQAPEWPDGRRYITKLRAFLSAHGYRDG